MQQDVESNLARDVDRIVRSRMAEFKIAPDSVSPGDLRQEHRDGDETYYFYKDVLLVWTKARRSEHGNLRYEIFIPEPGSGNDTPVGARSVL